MIFIEEKFEKENEKCINGKNFIIIFLIICFEQSIYFREMDKNNVSCSERWQKQKKKKNKKSEMG